jgi:hypothetical protein
VSQLQNLPGSLANTGVQRLVITRQLAPMLFLLLGLACADRTYVSPDDDAETGGPAPGEPFSGCMDKGDCFDEWCLHPADEPGFCTYACNGSVDSCEPVVGGTATSTCLPVEGDEVCALDCGGNKSCPYGMRCEQIEANEQARSICF